MKVKVETSVKKRDQRLLEFITIDVINIEQQHNSSWGIITLTTTPIIRSSFNKNAMSWELIHCRLPHPSDIVMKAMCCHQTLKRLPKHCLKILNKEPCTICYTAKTKKFTQRINS